MPGQRYWPIALLAIAFLLIAIPRINFPDLDHGDEFTDSYILNSADNFSRFGFIRCRFLPIFEPDRDAPDKPYTHYPALGENFNGLLRILFKSSSLYPLRSVALLFSFLALLLWYFFIKEATGSYFLSFLAALFYLANPLFIFGIDSLSAPYSEFFKSLILFLFIKLIHSSPKKRQLVFLCLWVVFALNSLLNYEYILFIFSFLLLYKFIFRKAKENLSLKELFLLMLAPVFSFLLHLLQNAWYFVSFSVAFRDLSQIAIERVAHSKDSSIPLSLASWFKLVIARNISLNFLFNYIVLFTFIFFSYLIYRNLSLKAREKISLAAKLWFILFLCGFSWYIAFPSHSLAHTFVLFLARHLMPGSALAFAIFCLLLLYFIKENKSGSILAKLPLAAVIVVILFVGILQSNLPVTRQSVAQARDFLIFKECMLKLNKISQKKDVVGVNYFRYPFIGYYTQRSCERIFDRPSLEGLAQLPRYFIFLPYQSGPTAELFQFLNQRYSLLYACRSSRFPGMFFKLKDK